MNNSTITKPVSDQAKDKRTKKRYEKPAVIHSQPLEAMALQCTPRPPGKAPGTVGCTSLYS